MNRIAKLFLIASLLFSKVILAQSSAKELGERLLHCYVTDSIRQLDKCFPTAEQLITYGRQHGLESKPDVIEAFNKRYPVLLEEVKANLQRIKEEGNSKGIDWKYIHTDGIETTRKMSPRADSDKDSLTINRVNIDFHYAIRSYRIVIENAIEIDGKYYLDNIIYFREITTD
ncbi:MAG: hypothetical protein RLZZ543_2327 [Bacteroidota bacterium]|jgi:hypothetical protein